MKNRRVCIISPEYPTYTNWGGIGRFNENLANLLSELGHEVHVFTYGKGNFYQEINIKNLATLHYIPHKTTSKFINIVYYSYPVRIFTSLFKKILPKTMLILEWNFFVFFYFKKLHKKKPIDIIHSPSYYSPSFLIKSVYRGIPLINHVQGSQEFLNQYEAKTLDNTFTTFIENKYLMTSNLIITCSKKVTQEIKRCFSSLKNRIFYLPNFIDTNDYISGSKINLNNIIFIGRLEYRKGVDVLINSFISLARDNKEICLYCIGEEGAGFGEKRDCSFRDFYESLSFPAHIKKRIFFIPRMDNKDSLLRLLNRLKGIAVFPSRYEPFGFVIIEAMALGYLVVASKNGGGKEIISHMHDGLITDSSVSSVKKNVLKILSFTNQEIKQMRKNAMFKIQSYYCLPILKKNYEHLYTAFK